MKGRIALFLHQPKCSVQSGNGIIKALEDHYHFKIFTKHRLERDFFKNVDMIAIPGGFGDTDSFDSLFRENGDRIRDFVAGGGRYLGVCMGAYWAAHHYFNILEDLDCVQYIRRPGTDTRRPHAKAIEVDWRGTKERMFFYDGCAIVGNGELQTVSKYANGDAMAGFQKRIGLIGCHPESEFSWYENYKYTLKHWHHTRHHELLRVFVNELMSR